MRLDEGDRAFQYVAGLESGKVGEYVLNGFAAQDSVGDAVERYARAGEAVAAVRFDISVGRQIAHRCFQLAAFRAAMLGRQNQRPQVERYSIRDSI